MMYSCPEPEGAEVGGERIETAAEVEDGLALKGGAGATVLVEEADAACWETEGAGHKGGALEPRCLRGVVHQQKRLVAGRGVITESINEPLDKPGSVGRVEPYPPLPVLGQAVVVERVE